MLGARGATGGLAAAALGFGAGTANAGGPYPWCPGQSITSGIDMETTPERLVVRKRGAQATSTQGVWDGATPPPPPEALTARQCPPIAFMCLWRRCAAFR